MERNQQKIKMRVFFWIGVALVGLASTTYLVQYRQIFQKRAAGTRASLTFPSSMPEQKTGNTFEIPILLNTDGASLSGIDIVVTFPQSVISLESIKPAAAQSTSLKLFMPVDASNNFDLASVKKKAQQTGRIEFGIMAFDPQKNMILPAYAGVLGVSNPLVTLVFKANNPTSQGVVSLVNNKTTQGDCNLLEVNSGADILNSTNQLNVKVTAISAKDTPGGSKLPPKTGRVTD